MCVMQMIAQIRSVSLALAPDVSPSWAAAVEVEEDDGGGGHRGVKWAKGKEEEGINSQWHACEYTHIGEEGFPSTFGKVA